MMDKRKNFSPRDARGDKRTPEKGAWRGKDTPKTAPHGKPAFSRKPGVSSEKGDPKPAARPVNTVDARRVALNALADVNRADAYASLALDKRLKEARLSGEDRRLCTSIFYSAVENRLKIRYILGQFAQRAPEAIIEDILEIALSQILFLDRVPAHAAVDEAVKQVRLFGREASAGFVNGTLRSILRAIESGEIKYPDPAAEPEKALSIECSIPVELIEMFTEAYGAETAEKIIRYRPEKRMETVRPNLLRMNAAEFEKFLTLRGWNWQRGIAANAYRIDGAGSLTADPEYIDGMFSVQGESSMIAAYALEAKPGMTILDACAAPGGKSALIGELMHGSGRVHSWDVHEHRVALIKAVASRLRLDNMRPALRDATVFREDMEGAMDGVLIDAPCSGTGVMADKPDIRYRITRERVASLAETQKKILDACCRYVKPGKMLVYSTCSILPQENEQQIRAFLLSHPDFALVKDDGYLPEALKPAMKDGMLITHPYRDGVEGFFIARMRRMGR